MFPLVGKLACSNLSTKCIERVVIRFINISSNKGNIPLVSAIAENKTASFEDVTKEKEIEVHTCGKLYEKWRKERKFWTVPTSDHTFNIKYIDTGHHGKESCKATVVSLHGSPGSYKEFDPITSHLYKKGVRVIAPNFPDAVPFPADNVVQPTKFRHTPEEKAQLIRDFLQALRVSRVDLILCHSSALFPGLHLSLDNKEVAVNSLALVNPTGLEIPRLLKPLWITKPMVKMCEFPMGYKISQAIGKRIANKPELKGGSLDKHFLSAYTLLHSSIPKQEVLFRALLNQNFPILLAFSHNDKLISKRTSYKMAEIMVDAKDVLIYDKNGNAHGSGGENPFRKVMAFEKGSHFLTRTYPDIISESISSFLSQQLENRAK
ncbi:hypothetical protein CDAR_299251 [Caerostris darwini]|uniref:Uncharacterized protein n=1 Tax=Caerostris darwini TaxID=1538125 RepID=A0AAV4PDX9_9ARAC|nr:hypothetical protein CDAR_299251 [Caerostris darwini]